MGRKLTTLLLGNDVRACLGRRFIALGNCELAVFDLLGNRDLLRNKQVHEVRVRNR